MITITWGDWFDDLAGLRDYIYQIHTVSDRNTILKEIGPLKNGGEGTIHLNETFVRMLLKNTTMKTFRFLIIGNNNELTFKIRFFSVLKNPFRIF